MVYSTKTCKDFSLPYDVRPESSESSEDEYDDDYLGGEIDAIGHSAGGLPLFQASDFDTLFPSPRERVPGLPAASAMPTPSSAGGPAASAMSAPVGAGGYCVRAPPRVPYDDEV